MNRDLMIFLLVLLVASLIGGFVGAEWADYDRTFSPTGAVVAAVVTAAALLGFGAYFSRQDRNKRRQKLPDDIRGVFDRMLGSQSPKPPSVQPATSSSTPAVEDSLRRKMASVDARKVQTFVSVMLKLGSMKDASKTAELARTKLLMQHDPIVAALKAQREFLEVLLDTSRGNTGVMGSGIANSCRYVRMSPAWSSARTAT